MTIGVLKKHQTTKPPNRKKGIRSNKFENGNRNAKTWEKDKRFG
jgi:hypothetical protein